MKIRIICAVKRTTNSQQIAAYCGGQGDDFNAVNGHITRPSGGCENGRGMRSSTASMAEHIDWRRAS